MYYINPTEAKQLREKTMNINKLNQSKLNRIRAAINLSEQSDFDKGYYAAKSGKDCSSCPHDMDDIGSHDSWVSGWIFGNRA